MPAPFARLESRVDRAVFGHLANTSGLLDGQAVDGIWDEAYLDIEGISTSGPVLTLPAAVAGCVVPHKSVFVRGTLVDGIVYSVVEARPDGAGMTLLRLREA